MKKVFMSFAALVAAFAAVSCVDEDYGGNVNTDTAVEVKVEEEPVETTGNDIIGVEATESVVIADEDGNTVEIPAVVSEETPEATATSEPVTISTFVPGEEIILKGSDIKVKVPISKDFPKDDVFSALTNPHFIIKVSNPLGVAFHYASTVHNPKWPDGTKDITIDADIPAIKGDVFVYVSESGAVAPKADAKRIDASKVNNFPQVFAGSPDELDIKDAKVEAISTETSSIQKAAAETVEFEFSAKSIFPLEVKGNAPFTIRKSFDISGVDLSSDEYKDMKKVAANVTLKHNIPFTMELALVEPDPSVVTVVCPVIKAAPFKNANSNETEFIEQTGDVSASSPKGPAAIGNKIVVDITAKLQGKSQFQISDDVKVSVKVNSYKLTVTL
ncbi:MAG: hypothetical protein J5764_02635 [Bacteroidales bacterium]|nr:hypothetical protein [Bacteroidales bacterium]